MIPDWLKWVLAVMAYVLLLAAQSPESASSRACPGGEGLDYLDLIPFSVGQPLCQSPKLAWEPLDTVAGPSEYLEPSYLVVITCEDWDDLQRLVPLGLHLLDWQEDEGSFLLAAIVTPQQLVTLRSMEFAVRVLDALATPEQSPELVSSRACRGVEGPYYLVTLPPSGETAPLYRHGQVFPYVAGAFILKADPACPEPCPECSRRTCPEQSRRVEAENLSIEGFFNQKLLGPIVLPASPPSAQVLSIDEGLGLSPQGYDPLIQSLVNTVSQTQIEDIIRDLQDDDSSPGWDAGRSRYSYSWELAIERDYIRDRMEALGLDVRYQGFSFNGTPLDNIEGTLSGWGPGSDTVYIVCAHYDSISDAPYNAAPGADDNASGTAVVLEAARVLSQYRFKHTLRFVTFAAEEQGLIGSYYYVAEARTAGTDIGGVINHDMVSWDSNSDDVIEVHVGTRSESQALGTAFMNAMTMYGISLVPQYITSGATTYSDHARFWNQGYPAMLAIEDFQDFNPYYHSTDDTLDKLDLPYAAKFAQTTVAALAELAEIIPPGVRVEHTGPGTVTTDTLTTLTIKYSNPGPGPATSVVMTDTLSTGLTYVEDSSGFTVTQPSSGTVVWQVGDVMSYTQSSFVITASVAATLPVGAQVTSTVDITGVVAWDDPGDNRATWTGSVPYMRLYLPVLFKDSP